MKRKAPDTPVDSQEAGEDAIDPSVLDDPRVVLDLMWAPRKRAPEWHRQLRSRWEELMALNPRSVLAALQGCASTHRGRVGEREALLFSFGAHWDSCHQSWGWPLRCLGVKPQVLVQQAPAVLQYAAVTGDETLRERMVQNWRRLLARAPDLAELLHECGGCLAPGSELPVMAQRARALLLDELRLEQSRRESDRTDPAPGQADPEQQRAYLHMHAAVTVGWKTLSMDELVPAIEWMLRSPRHHAAFDGALASRWVELRSHDEARAHAQLDRLNQGSQREWYVGQWITRHADARAADFRVVGLPPEFRMRQPPRRPPKPAVPPAAPATLPHRPAFRTRSILSFFSKKTSQPSE